MLEARPNRRFDWLFDRYNSIYLLRKHFRSIQLAGDLIPPETEGRPLLYIMNHSSWWDGLLAYHAWKRETKGGTLYVMMEEKQLARYSFFRKLGAYSIDRTQTAGIRASLRYTAELLQSGRRVLLYPQGELLPLETRPLALKDGPALVLRMCPETAVVPLTLYHGLFRHTKPEATLLAGEPIQRDWQQMNREETVKCLTDALEGQLDEHRHRVLTSAGDSPDGFRPLLRGGLSTSEWFDAVFRRRSRR